ncbi:hypothetical protein HanRHA438_Chr15g0714451 [Helianthus annuus]|uniref:Uncharacterized protein n=1 Tax=Helianthus annuus TaxID=4232 RepID=A0A251S5V9_HELAN|nr:hypothetical protein HanXRQr2_Chr15g0702111 [Helianthus annuus]KAJ0831997.1 hypothetical protein HanPSC8_Chr15g0673631 [Helianthus annuus]KAJ0845509.1 hypothetical protein HanRHA438_Chr15g0714451 [Helianthus annuus]
MSFNNVWAHSIRERGRRWLVLVVVISVGGSDWRWWRLVVLVSESCNDGGRAPGGSGSRW